MNPPDFSIKNRIVLITGASKGIGRGLALLLAKAGAKVAFTATARSLPELQSLQKEIQDCGGVCHPFTANLGSVDEINALVASVEQQVGPIDILVNNAGLGFNHDAVDVTEADWDDMMNVKALFFCCQAVGKRMLERGYGRIVNMSSQASIVGIPRHAVYCATKGAVNQLTKVLALEWSARGVTVNAVGPTFIYTPGTAERLDQPEFRQSVVSRIPAGKVGTIEDVAGAVIYLASPAAGLVTGTLLLVDGGWTAQ